MDKEALENIFVPFYSTKTNGTGIGMAITKKIIDHHGGAIRVNSRLGQGAKVTIKIPAASS